MYWNNSIYLGLSEEGRICLDLSVANRHGMITGASGTGKTITMKVMAESFSDAGVPVFLCDMKGDVSGLCTPGAASDGMEKRIDRFGIREDFRYTAYPVCFWDVYGEQGHPVRITVSDLGPELLSRILGLTPAQEGVLNILFRIADDQGLLLIDLKDLRAMLEYVREHREEYCASHGNITTQSLSAILRSLLPLENQGGDLFFGEPALNIMDWMRLAPDGRGYINLLDCVKLGQNPLLYATFLLWMLSELYETLPEAGNLDQPKLVFFFDEAHMLFRDAPRALVQKIEQVVRLVRSKGVGVYFVTQSPADIPDAVLAQLSHRIQHALRAYTPAEQKAIRAAAAALRPNPAFKTEELISNLGTGYALVSLLDSEGVPGIVQHAAIICPQSLMAPGTEQDRAASLRCDGMQRYDTAVDNYTAYEQLEEVAEEERKEKEEAALAEQRKKEEEAARKQAEKEEAAAQRKAEREEAAAQRKAEREEAAAQRKAEREEAAAQKKAEREEAAVQRKAEREAAAKQKRADSRRSKIETQLIRTGASVLTRGLFGTLRRR